MKNYFKFFGIVALVVTIGLLTFGCSSDSDGDKNAELAGNWKSGNIVVRIKGAEGVFTVIEDDGIGWDQTRDKNQVKIGDKKFIDIKWFDVLKWRGQTLLYDPNNYNKAGFKRCTFTLSADKKTLTVVVDSGLGYTEGSYGTYTKQ